MFTDFISIFSFTTIVPVIVTICSTLVKIVIIANIP